MSRVFSVRNCGNEKESKKVFLQTQNVIARFRVITKRLFPQRLEESSKNKCSVVHNVCYGKMSVPKHTMCILFSFLILDFTELN